MTQAERTRTTKYVLAESSKQMAAAQTKGHEEDKHTRMQEKNKIRKKRKTKNEKRKEGSKAQKQASKKIVLKASP